MSGHAGQHGTAAMGPCSRSVPAAVLTANAKLLCVPAHPSHGQQPGAEEVTDGPGYLHEDGRLPLHRHLLRSTFPRGMASQRPAALPWGAGSPPRLRIPQPPSESKGLI